MLYQRPWIQRPSRPVFVARQRSALDGLGDLGDNAVGIGPNGSITLFQAYLQTYIAAKAGPSALANAKNAPSLAGSIGICASIFLLGESSSLPADQQAYWNQWRAAASPSASPENVAWLFGRMVASNKDDLIRATMAYSAVWADNTASAASFTLVDTSTSGTTWYGGTTVQSALTNDQWGTLFIKAWGVLSRGVINGVLPLTYLEVLCRAMVQQPAARRMPVFLPPPGNLAATDPRAIAFRAAMKQLGWSGVISTWFSYTQQAWAASNSAYEQQDEAYGAAITGLSYVSGAKILEQIQSKAQDYFQARSDAAAALSAFDVLATGPLKDKISQFDLATASALKQQFQSTDSMAYDTLNPAGLWGISSQPGALGSLGAIQLLLAGVLAVTALGVIAYVVTIMTKCARDAAAQTKATADSLLATVATVSDSCQRTYDSSSKGADAEAAYQACLMQTKALTDSIPKPPDSSDPLGLKSMALLGAVGVVGLLAITFIKSRSK